MNTFYLDTATRTQMEVEILSDSELESRFDGKRLLDGDYTDEEMRKIIAQYIIDGDETGYSKESK